jgi:hypothetical protein
MKTAKRDASGKGDPAFECSCLKFYAPVEYFLRYLRRDDIKRIPKGFDGIYRYHYPDRFRNYGNPFARAKKSCGPYISSPEAIRAKSLNSHLK